MAKSKPIGVRFDEDLFNEVKKRGIKTAQQALSLYESAYKKEMSGTWEIGAKLVEAARGSDNSETAESIKAEIEECEKELKGLSANSYANDVRRTLTNKMYQLNKKLKELQ